MDSRDHERRGLVEELGGEDVHVPTPVRKVALASFIGTTVEWVRLLHLRHGRGASVRAAIFPRVQSVG